MYDENESWSFGAGVIVTCVVIVLAVLMGTCAHNTTIREDKIKNLSPTEQALKRHGVELYFEVDGCKVYKFDGANGYTSHFATCPGTIGSAYHSGKSTKPDEIDTVVQ